MSSAQNCENVKVGRDKIADEKHCGSDDLIKKLYDELSPKVTYVRGTREIGSGFFVNNGDEIVTNAHVATSDKSLTVVAADGNAYPAYVEKYDDIHDLALLKVVGIDPDRSRAVNLAPEEDAAPQQAYTIGHPGLFRTTISPGEKVGEGTQLEAMTKQMGSADSSKLVENALSKFDQTQKEDYLDQIKSKELWYSQFQLKGSSGSPQFNDKGELVGVVHTGYDLSSGKMTGTIELSSAVKQLLSEDPGRFSFKYAFMPYVIKTAEGKIQAAVPAPLQKIIRNTDKNGTNSAPFFYDLGP